MAINITLLPAEHGDCIFVSAYDYNILIDGGVAQTYQDLHDRRNPDKPLKLLIDKLHEENKHIDLLIVTHVDDDHIGGIIEWFEDEFPEEDLVREIWMNDDVILSDKSSLQNSPTQAGKLLGLWRDKGRCYNNNIVQGEEFDRGPFHIKVLAPLSKYRNGIAEKISASLHNTGTANGADSVSLKELAAKPWKNGTLTKENRASIAFELSTIEDDKVLLLGDAHVKDIMNGLDCFYPNQEHPIKYKTIKLSHHGSKNNFCPAFIQMVHADTFLVSTNGDFFGHPDKEVIAQIICNTDSIIGFNYGERKDSLFTKQDFMDFPNLKERVFTTISCLE